MLTEIPEKTAVVAELTELEDEFSTDGGICSLLVADVDNEEKMRLLDAVDAIAEVDDCWDKDDVVFTRLNAA
jgi:hypothetical protein